MSSRTCRSSSRGGKSSKSQLVPGSVSLCFPFALERSRIGLCGCAGAESAQGRCDAVTFEGSDSPSSFPQFLVDEPACLACQVAQSIDVVLLDRLQYALPLQSLISRRGLFKWGGRSRRTRVGQSLERIWSSLPISGSLVVVELHRPWRSKMHAK